MEHLLIVSSPLGTFVQRLRDSGSYGRKGRPWELRRLKFSGGPGFGARRGKHRPAMAKKRTPPRDSGKVGQTTYTLGLGAGEHAAHLSRQARLGRLSMRHA